MDAVEEDKQVVGVRVEDTKNRSKWKTVIPCGDAWEGTSRKEKKNSTFKNSQLNIYEKNFK